MRTRDDRIIELYEKNYPIMAISKIYNVDVHYIVNLVHSQIVK